MKLWRISNYVDLRGLGGIKVAGRWHNKGIPVVYLAESPALAMIESLVNLDLDINEVPENFQLLEVEYAERKGVSRLSENALPAGWQEDVSLTRAVGDEWLTSLKGAFLRVPSAIVPQSFNYLLNPRHSLAPQAHIISIKLHPFDNRLL